MKRDLNTLPDYAPISIREIAELFNSGKSTIENWIKMGKFPPPDLWVGRKRCWRLGTVRKLLATSINKISTSVANRYPGDLSVVVAGTGSQHM